MEKLSFINYQEEVSLSCFVPTNHLKEYNAILLNDLFKMVTMEERMLLIVLDRDGYFYTKIKPRPEFLLLLKEHKIHVQASSLFNQFISIYGCFLKSFVLKNPKFQPLLFL